jgi:hypothetical protein
MAAKDAKPEWPFMVFAESLPQAGRLADPNTPADERDTIRREINAVMDMVKDVADRNTQRGRHEKDYEKRARVMADLKRNALGKPLRGEPARVAELHGVRVIQVRKWIEQLKKAPRKGSAAIQGDWRTIYYGQALRHQRSVAARRAKNRQD